MVYAGRKGVVFSAVLFSATVVLFPYFGLLLTVTCRDEKHSQLPGALSAAHPDYLEIGEKCWFMKQCFVLLTVLFCKKVIMCGTNMFCIVGA